MSDDRDDFEERLQEALRRATPDAPPDTTRADAARRYARSARRTKGLLAVGAAAAVVAAIVVVPTVIGSGSGSNQPVAGPTGTEPTAVLPTPKLAHPYYCPSSTGGVGLVPGAERPGNTSQQPPNGEVPTGAVLARLCTSGVGGWVSSGPVIQPARELVVTAPQEALVTNLDKLVQTVNGLPQQQVPVACPLSVQPSRYSIVFQYADGQTVPVYATTQGCDVVMTGAVRRSGAGPLLREFLRLLDQQHQRYAPPSSPVEPAACPNDRSDRLSGLQSILVDASRLRLRTAMVCEYVYPSSVRPQSTGRLSAREIAFLERDIATSASRSRPPHADVPCLGGAGDVSTQLIVGVDAWGNSVELGDDLCGIYQFTDRNGSWYWHPTPATQRMLTDALKLPGNPLLTPPGHVSGRLLAVGGPAGTPSRPLAGVVTVSGANGATKVKVGASGRFHASLPPGRYRIQGYSPAYMNFAAACTTEHPFVTLTSKRPVKVDVYCQEK